VDVGTRVLARDPLRLARRHCDLAVDRQRQLERDARPAQVQASQPTRHAVPRGVGTLAYRNGDSGLLQDAEAVTRRARVGVLQRRHHSTDASRDDQLRAARAAIAKVRAGLQARVEGGVAGLASRFGQRHRFRMGPPARLGRAPSDDLPVGNDNAADIRVRRRGPARVRTQPDGVGYPGRVTRCRIDRPIP
jgi:hypothetical protein